MSCFNFGSNNGCCEWIIVLILIAILCGDRDNGCGCSNC